MNTGKTYLRGMVCLLVFVGVCGSLVYGEGAVSGDRTAGWHRAIVTMGTGVPNAAVSAYAPANAQYLFSKIVAGVEVEGAVVWASKATEVSVADFPGGIRAEYMLGGVKVVAEILPLMVGRGAEKQEGGMLYTVRTEPAAKVVVKCGEIATGDAHGVRANLVNDNVGNAAAGVEIVEGIAEFVSSRILFAAMKTDGAMEVADGDENAGKILKVTVEDGEGKLVFGFSEDKGRAREIAGMDAAAGRAEVTEYYDGFLSGCRIETPEKVMDDAFRNALITLEYNWLEPYGWMESVRHWLMMWHMQASGAADLIGQEDRSRDCIMSHAERLLPTGAAPQMSTDGETHREIFTAGSNQFYAWQIRHYWETTGDAERLGYLAGILEKVIGQTYSEFDRDNNLLLAWGPQIGNQEDWVHTPNDGTTPTIDGIEMMRTRLAMARHLGETEKELYYAARIAKATESLKAELWQAELGWFMYYRDAVGLGRPEGQYHTLIYPAMYGITDMFDSWTSIRHLRDQLMGEGGEVYCSNNFPDHSGTTSGVQAGAAQQPWGAWGLASVGLRNETYRPLKAVSQWVMSDTLKGSWPEVQLEPIAAYFSPPAGLFVQSTIEALFGLKVNKPDGYIGVSPSFPDAWDKAKVELPEYSASYSRKGDVFAYSVTSKEELGRRLRWMLPVGEVGSVKVNGKKVEYKVEPGIECVTVVVETAAMRETDFEVSMKPLDITVDCPKSIAEGDELNLKVTGVEITGIYDQCGVLAGIDMVSGTEMKSVVMKGLLEDYLHYGKIGQMNFSRRTFFVSGVTKRGQQVYLPVDITILPSYEAVTVGQVVVDGDAGKVVLHIRNNMSKALSGKGELELVRRTFAFDVDLAGRSEGEYEVVIPTGNVGLLSPGKNGGKVTLPSGDVLEVSVTASEAIKSVAELSEYAKRQVEHIALPEELLEPDSEISFLRDVYGYSWNTFGPYGLNLSSVVDGNDLAIEKLPAVTFGIAGRQWVAVSWKSGQPSVTLDMKGKHYKKLYLLVAGLLDNQDMYVPVAQVSVRAVDGGIASKVYYTPGDLDWSHGGIMGHLQRTVVERGDKAGALLPMLDRGTGEWSEARPPAFPQKRFWADCLEVIKPSITMNVIEIEPEPVALRSVTLSTFGVDPTVLLIAMSGELLEEQEESAELDKWLPESERIRVLFGLNEAGNMEGWTTTDPNEFGVQEAFNVTGLNSYGSLLGKGVGKAVSPDFVIEGGYLNFVYRGGGSHLPDGPGALNVRMVDSATGEVLFFKKAPAPWTFVPQKARVPLDEWKGRTVHLELVDENPGERAGWIGITDVTISPN